MREARLGHTFGPLAREIVARFGPPPHWKQLSLLAADDEEERQVDEARSVLDRLDPPPKVLIVGYACSARLGLLGSPGARRRWAMTASCTGTTTSRHPSPPTRQGQRTDRTGSDPPLGYREQEA
jgi:hypothetical protein